MSQAQNNNSGIGVLAAIIVGLAFLLQLISGGAGQSGSSAPSAAPARDNSFERRYVEERFKQEGYSRDESAQAADAILKFQRAQEARRAR